MNRKDGFVATSLIYSFFLAFLAIFAALLANYISNKTILDRFNGDTLDDLNNRTFSLNIYATNANIDSGFAFTNLLAEATFETLLYWNNEGGNFSQITNYDGKQFAIKKETNSSTSSIDQEVYILDNTKYYYSVRCKNMADDETNILKSYLKNDLHSFGTLSCKPADDSWQKNSDIFTSEEGDAGMYKFIVGENDTWNSESSAFFTEVVLINLTDSFGAGHEPTREWLDKNVDFFSDTVSFITMDKI